MGIVSLDQMRAHLNITTPDPGEDAELARMIEAADGAIEAFLGVVVAPRSVTERHIIPPGGMVCLRAVPVIEVTALVASDGSTVFDAARVDLDGDLGVLRAGSSSAVGDVSVSFVAGMNDPPARYELAEMLIAAHMWETQRVQTLAQGFSYGGEDQFQGQFGRGYSLPNRAIQLLGARTPNVP